MVDNSAYVGITKRVIYEKIYNFYPYGHVVAFVYFNIDWQSYDHLVKELAHKLGITNKEMWAMTIDDNVSTEETLKKV